MLVTSTQADRTARTQAAVAEQALASLREGVDALAEAVAAADPPPFYVAEVQAILDERGATSVADHRYGVLVATAQRWAAGLTTQLHHDYTYRTLLGDYQRQQMADQVLQVSVEAGGLGCDLTIALPLALAGQARAADGPGGPPGRVGAGLERGPAASRGAGCDRG